MPGMWIDDTNAVARDAERDAWKQGFTQSTDGKWSCDECAALVTAFPEHLARHREWHERVGN